MTAGVEVGDAGLLGGFGSSMAGTTADDVESFAVGADPGDEPVGAEPLTPNDAEAGEPVSAAAALAERLLGRTTAAHSGSWRLVGRAPAGTVVVRSGVEVGRRADAVPSPNLLACSSRHVSRRHCRVERCDDTLVVRDLGSANGTVVVRGEGTIVVSTSPIELHDGDTIATADGLVTIAHVERTGGVP